MTSHHDQPPQKAPAGVDAEVLRMIRELESSPYYQYVSGLSPLVEGKQVVHTAAGTSGFILLLDSGTWVAAYLDDEVLCWKTGSETPSSDVLRLLFTPAAGHTSQPMDGDFPYAGEECDHEGEVARSRGHRITGLSQGARCFNFCFPHGRELDVTLRRDAQGRLGYRVFWEQW